MAHVRNARAAYEAARWSEASSQFQEAEQAGEPLSGWDHHQWGMARYWQRDVDGALRRLQRAAQVCRTEREGEAEATSLEMAIQIASWARRDAVVSACAARLFPLLEELPESEPHAIVQWAMACAEVDRDLERGTHMLEDAMATALRVRSPGAEALVLTTLSQVDTAHCRVEDAMRKVDAAAALALSGEVSEMVAGGVLCGLIWSCRNVGDWERASRWTEVAASWSLRAQVAMFPGLCQFHRCEILRVRGDLDGAETSAERACAELGTIAPAGGVGYGYRELGTIRLLRGDADGARAAFRTALEEGVDPNPGLALLRLREGNVRGARRGLEEALASPQLWLDVPFLLPTLVTACVAEDDVPAARAASERLTELAERFGTDSHRAAAAQARAEVALAAGDTDTARREAHLAWQSWTDARAPWEAARARETIGLVDLAEGAPVDARFSLEAAQASYARVGATFDAHRIDQQLERLGRPDAPPGARAFMFTDIVDSTPIQAALGDDRWLAVLNWHDRTLRAVFEEHDGEVVKHEGDGFFVSFGSGAHALRAACQIQRSLADHRNHAGFAPDVRIGVHEGSAVPRAGDWIGLAVTITARVAGLAGAGEVVCTEEVVRSVPSATVVERRTVRPKGIAGEMEISVVESCP